MKLPKILMVAAIMMMTCAVVVAASMGDVDWRNRVVTVTGEGVAPPNAVNRTQARALASRSAQADAYRRLAETINGVRVEGEDLALRRRLRAQELSTKLFLATAAIASKCKCRFSA